jgi:hypothetical protein
VKKSKGFILPSILYGAIVGAGSLGSWLVKVQELLEQQSDMQ